ncbi:MAG: YkgJ family cysteine cluster protein [Lactovum sp.]
MNLERYRNLAIQKQKEHRKILSQLKNKKIKNLDRLTAKIHEEVFSEIDCTQCANCCKILGPLWTESDITRVAKYLKMKVSDFERRYLKIDDDGDKVFQTMPCPFLGADNLCSIYEIRPKACHEFPHTDRKKFYQINHLTIKNTVYCPAAYEFVEKLKDRV